MSATNDQVYRPLGSEDLHELKFIAIEEAVDIVLYGVQLALSIAAITILARRHGRSRFTLVAICGLLSSSTIYTVTNTAFYLVQFPVVIGTSERAIEGFLERLNILSNVSKNLNVMGGIAEQAWIYWPSLYDPYTVESNGQFLVRFFPLLITNIVATVLIGTKVLHYRREVKGSLGLFTQRTQAETILLLLLESGIAYILFWIADCTMAFVAYQYVFSGGAIFTNISHHIAGIYPTCVLFAAAGGTTESLLSAQVSQAMRFGDPPAAHEGARDADTTVDFHLEDPAGALNDGPQDLCSPTDNLAGPSGTRSGESRFASSEGIIEVERETTAM
ncbi:hypothetical protein K523DRAFT_287655 [Schizophyllum commune Tattone D]|nr:hypothetical protein K523DRAFT_287655 [Schizophyllum commune Tattone D]